MPIVIGLAIGIAVIALGRLAALDRDRAFYPVALIVIAAYYILFAVMAGNRSGLPGELIFSGLFMACAVVGFRVSLWIVVAGLMMHGVFDFTRQLFLPGSGVPLWWPAFCLAADVAIGAGLAALLMWGRIASTWAREAR